MNKNNDLEKYISVILIGVVIFVSFIIWVNYEPYDSKSIDKIIVNGEMSLGTQGEIGDIQWNIY